MLQRSLKRKIRLVIFIIGVTSFAPRLPCRVRLQSAPFLL